ncbi:MAG: pilin [Patescibacteria group bacterium]
MRRDKKIILAGAVVLVSCFFYSKIVLAENLDDTRRSFEQVEEEESTRVGTCLYVLYDGEGASAQPIGPQCDYVMDYELDDYAEVGGEGGTVFRNNPFRSGEAACVQRRCNGDIYSGNHRGCGYNEGLSPDCDGRIQRYREFNQPIVEDQERQRAIQAGEEVTPYGFYGIDVDRCQVDNDVPASIRTYLLLEEEEPACKCRVRFVGTFNENQSYDGNRNACGLNQEQYFPFYDTIDPSQFFTENILLQFNQPSFFRSNGEAGRCLPIRFTDEEQGRIVSNPILNNPEVRFLHLEDQNNPENYEEVANGLRVLLSGYRFCNQDSVFTTFKEITLNPFILGPNPVLPEPPEPLTGYQGIPFSLPDATSLNQFFSGTSLAQIVGRLLNLAFVFFVGAAALGMFIYSGVLVMTAAGNAEKHKKAFQIMLWTTLGVIAMLSAYIIVSFVFGAFG